MGLFSKRSQFKKELIYNRGKLLDHMAAVSKKLYTVRDEKSWQIVKEIILTEKNLLILHLGAARDVDEIKAKQAEISVLNRLLSHIDECIAEGEMTKQARKERKTRSPGAISQPRRRMNNTAGAVI